MCFTCEEHCLHCTYIEEVARPYDFKMGFARTQLVVSRLCPGCLEACDLQHEALAVDGYCNACATRIYISNAEEITLHSGRKAYGGYCPFCHGRIIDVLPAILGAWA